MPSGRHRGLCSAALRGLRRRRIRVRRPNRINVVRDLRDFVVTEILREDPITLLGRFPWQSPAKQAIVKVNPTTLGAAEAVALLPDMTLRMTSYSGAEYCFFKATPPPASPDLPLHPSHRREYTIEVIAPASDSQILSCRPPAAFVMIEETPEMYDGVVRPGYTKARVVHTLGWLYNILDRTEETERLLFHDGDPDLGFVINVDTKWTSHPNCSATSRAEWHNHRCVRDLHCLGICNRRDLACLRDLTGDHLPLLRAMLSRGQEAIHKVYGLPPHKVRVFVHYPPQFRHFHIHFTSLFLEDGVEVERAHLLSHVIRNLEADGSHYRNCTLTYKLPEEHRLASKLKDFTPPMKPHTKKKKKRPTESFAIGS